MMRRSNDSGASAGLLVGIIAFAGFVGGYVTRHVSRTPSPVLSSFSTLLTGSQNQSVTSQYPLWDLYREVSQGARQPSTRIDETARQYNLFDEAYTLPFTSFDR